MGRLWRVALVTAVATAATACGSSAPDAVTGLGGTVSAWNGRHGPEYSSVVADPAGRVEAYVVTMSPRPLAQAEDLIRRDLPADTTAAAPVLGHGVEGGVCEIVVFTSPTLAKRFGDAAGARAVAAFSAANATVHDTARVARAVVTSGVQHLPAAC